MTAAQTPPILQMEGITKTFPGVRALQRVELTVHRGECIGLVGENGAGKSTLMKILAGVYQADEGQLYIDGQPALLHGPRDAQARGISIIYQEFNLMPNLSVAENVWIGREAATAGFVRWRDLFERTRALLAQLGIDLPPAAIVRDLSVAEQQMVEIAKALSVQASLIIMDEPTSALTEREVAALLQIVQHLKARGIGVVFISHRLREIEVICDRVVVLRDGQNMGNFPIAAATQDVIVRAMVGRSAEDLFQRSHTTARTEFALEVRGLSRAGAVGDPRAISLQDISLRLRRGEIVGLAGLVGAGRTELARSIFGADRPDSGEILVDGRPAAIRSPRDAIRAGIGFVPEDRKEQGLILGMAVRENISLAYLGRLARAGFLRLGAERVLSQHYIRQLGIRTPSMEQQVVNLSGGNQQKVVIAKWLALSPRILIMDEPTRGVDVAAKAEVHALMHQLAQQGMGILLISSELPEVLGLSDRVLVMRRGQVVGELQRGDATEQRVMMLATGSVATAAG